MKKSLLAVMGLIVVCAWLSLIPGYMIVNDDTAMWAVWVTGVAVITEIGFWVTAATLGVAVFEARRSVWRWLTRGGAA